MEGQRPDRAAVGKRLMDGEVEAVVSALELGAVERASAPRDREPPARVALPGLVLGALLVEQRLDAGVRGGLERLLPARGGAAAAPDLLSLLVRARFLEQRQRDRKQVGRRGVGLGARPADDRLLHLLREHALELGSRLLRGDDDDPRRAQLPDRLVERVGDLAKVVVDELLDVPLVARLRPAALVA